MDLVDSRPAFSISCNRCSASSARASAAARASLFVFLARQLVEALLVVVALALTTLFLRFFRLGLFGFGLIVFRGLRLFLEADSWLLVRDIDGVEILDSVTQIQFFLFVAHIRPHIGVTMLEASVTTHSTLSSLITR
jgi:hypothetical protein